MKFSGAPASVIATAAVCVPPFGGFWMYSLSVLASRTYCVVTEALLKLFVYAVASAFAVLPLSEASG